MSYTSIDAIFVVIIICVGSFTAFGEEFPGEDYTKEEYLHIFKNIPVLFEYLLVALEDKPEVLETDNVMAFNDIVNNNVKELDKRDVGDEEDDNDGEQDSVSRIADDIFDDVEGLDDGSDETEEDKSKETKNEDGHVKLTPEEVEEKFLMVEKMLEDYNKS